MCTTWVGAAAVIIAAMGSMSTARPSTQRNPVGAFIHAFAMTTNRAESMPLTATAQPAARWARREMRSHPYR